MSNTTMRHNATSNRGFTLVELLVSVAVMAIMITIVSTIVSECHKLVKSSQATMRCNNTAGAIAQLLRNDVSSISQNGLLFISTIDNKPIVMFTTAGPARALVAIDDVTHDYVQGAGTLTMIGQMDNAGKAGGDVLWRAAYVFAPHMPMDWGKDAFGGHDLASIQALPAEMKTMCIDWKNAVETTKLHVPVEEKLHVPVEAIADVRDLWQVVATGLTEFGVSWKDDTGWHEPDGTDMIWTHHDQNAWPTAIKFNFKLSDPEAPADYRELEYEVVCPLVQ
ncbi:MAG: prepilin-type N-terminal cleavage/methylation domain-containing protein [Planctomycetes bacterium]|nr:prepilin-type N-terminal cleavage/methylation domain-containing protein [Planctomycetota bacterium]